MLKNSVSRLEKFAACAYAHFLKYGLTLEERDKYSFESVDMGNVFHAVLENFSEKIAEEGYTWLDFPKEVGERLVSDCLESYAVEYGETVLYSSKRNEYMITRMRRILNRTVQTLQYQLSQGVFTPENFEMSFQMVSDLDSVNIALSDEEKMHLIGRIDRVDTYKKEDKIYVKVIDYYRNFKTDNAATSIALILNSLYGTSSDSTVKCGCNSDLSEATYNTSTCSELYASAMETYLKQMLSDHQFYTDWFMIDTENNVDGVIPNEILIGLLVELIKEFLKLEHSLIFKTHTNNNCECPVVDYDEDDCNHKILEQYLKVLGYAVTNTIDANVNKIKVYGGQFAELLPYLIF